MARAVVLAGFLAALLPTGVFAAPKVTVKTTTFSISGTSGTAIMAALDRKGPKHGFMSRAIAQTRYEMNSEAEWTHRDGWCMVTKPAVVIDITYVYPKLTGPVPSTLQQRWQAFMAGVTRHEKVHGRLAKEMAFAAEKALSKVRVRDDKDCRRFSAEMKRAVNAVVTDYERRQVAFDDAEHKPGSSIDRLIRKLVK